MRTASTMTCWLHFIVAAVAEELFCISTKGSGFSDVELSTCEMQA